MLAIEKNLKIAMASDHAGFELKQYLKQIFEKQLIIQDFGCFSKESIDYPDFAYVASKSVSQGEADKGILICGSGTGMSIVANKVSGIRAANCQSVEIVEFAVAHNNINILCLGARFLDADLSTNIVNMFLAAKFEGGRHLNRVNKIHSLTKM